jgi:hypothetical protein
MSIFRILLDRGLTPWDDALNELDLSSCPPSDPVLQDYYQHIADSKM